MADVVVRLGLDRPGDELILAQAIETYARWRQYMCDPDGRQDEADTPDIMVKTGWNQSGAMCKEVIFPERRWAAAFLRIWRLQRRAGAN